MRLLFGPVCFALFLQPPGASAVPATCEVNVNVDLTEAGRKIVPPTREQPAYYLPLIVGYREAGAVSAGTKSPDRTFVLRHFAVTLAERGYLVVGPKTPPPTLLLVFRWGSMNPSGDDFGDIANPAPVYYDERQMLGLVGGQTLKNLDLFSERETVIQEAREDRYFATITAYDFAAAQQKKKVLLWRAKMSTPSNRTELAEVVTALIKSGGPYFGRETLRPAWVTAPLETSGKVNLGVMQVKEFIDPASPASKK